MSSQLLSSVGHLLPPPPSPLHSLLVLGMQRFGHTAWKETCLNLLPTKTVPQLKNHVKNLCAVKRKWNIVKVCSVYASSEAGARSHDSHVTWCVATEEDWSVGAQPYRAGWTGRLALMGAGEGRGCA